MPPRLVDCLIPLYSIGVKCLPQGHNDTLTSLGTELRVDNLAVANMRSFPPSCTAAGWDDSVKRWNTAARYAQYDRRISNLTITLDTLTD